MPEIGATLREARMRARIDIAEIETATKIRAKYLRALENEEWDLLPGPTFVKTFLRTYAEALGLDAKLLVDEYKVRHERLSDTELRPISPRSNAQGSRPSRRPGGMRAAGGRRSPRIPIAVLLVLAIVGVLFVLGATNDPPADRVPPASTAASGTTGARTTSTATSTGTAAPTPRAKPKPRTATLRIIPTGDVEVCLRAKGRPVALVNGVVLRSTDPVTAFKSTRFRISLGNNNARLVVNGKSRRPAAASPVGYAITRTGFRRLRASELPSCG